MHVIHVAAECAPHAKAGGLADVVAALPRALKSLRPSTEGTVLLPCYDWLRDGAGPVLASGSCSAGSFDLRVLEAERDLPHLVVDHACFAGEGVYPADADVLARAVVLAAAALHAARGLPGIRPADVLHVHDHHPALACIGLSGSPPPPPTVLTVHNARYHGALDWALADSAGLPEDLDRGACDHDERFNLLKAGLLHAGRITTVSPTHAVELRSDPLSSAGLDYVFRMVSSRLTGILNGIDLATWSPAEDPALDRPFAPGDLDGKRRQSAVLREELGLDADAPLAAFIGRLVPEKGVEVLLEGWPLVLEAEPAAQLIVLGSGEPRYASALAELARRCPGVRAAARHDEDFAHRLYASAELLLMPSWHEPCGLSQMHAQRYGTVPVVHPVGGLRDSIRPFDPATGSGDGLWMKRADAESLAEAVGLALSWRRDAPTWSRLVANCFAADHGWSRSAAEHAALHRGLLELP